MSSAALPNPSFLCQFLAENVRDLILNPSESPHPGRATKRTEIFLLALGTPAAVGPGASRLSQGSGGQPDLFLA